MAGAEKKTLRGKDALTLSFPGMVAFLSIYSGVAWCISVAEAGERRRHCTFTGSVHILDTYVFQGDEIRKAIQRIL